MTDTQELIGESEAAFDELLKDLQEDRKSFQTLAQNYLDALEKLNKAFFKNDALYDNDAIDIDHIDALHEDCRSKMVDMRRELEKLGYKDVFTDKDTPSALGTSIPNTISGIWNIGKGLFAVYRGVDAVLRAPEHFKQAKSFVQSIIPPDTQAVPEASENAYRPRDLVNQSSEQCAPIDLKRVKEFLAATEVSK